MSRSFFFRGSSSVVARTLQISSNFPPPPPPPKHPSINPRDASQRPRVFRLQSRSATDVGKQNYYYGRYDERKNHAFPCRSLTERSGRVAFETNYEIHPRVLYTVRVYTVRRRSVEGRNVNNNRTCKRRSARTGDENRENQSARRALAVG